METKIGADNSRPDIASLEVSDIQATVLRPRPHPYKGEYVILRIDDAAQGREMLRRVLPHVAPADDWWKPILPGWLGIAFTYQGLGALGLPKTSLDSFPEEFREGMAARASLIGDVDASAPASWEPGPGAPGVHVMVMISARDRIRWP